MERDIFGFVLSAQGESVTVGVVAGGSEGLLTMQVPRPALDAAGVAVASRLVKDDSENWFVATLGDDGGLSNFAPAPRRHDLEGVSDVRAD